MKHTLILKENIQLTIKETIFHQLINHNQTTNQMAKVTAAQGAQSVASKNAQSTPVSEKKVKQLTYLQIRKESLQDREERELQYEVENNLDNLMSDICATSRELATAIRSRDAILQTGNVSWNNLAEKDKQIEGYEKGLARLKSYRSCYFPNWSKLLTEE